MNEFICSCCGAEAIALDSGYCCIICGHFQRKLLFDPLIRYADLKDRNHEATLDPSKKFLERLQSLNPYIYDGADILELGCAEGTLGNMVKAKYQVNYTGVELSHDAKKARLSLDKVVSDISELNNSRYDLILAYHVLEHFEDINKALTSWKKLLKNDRSKLIIEVPNKSGNPAIKIDRNIEHAHQFTTASLEILLKNSELRTESLMTGIFESSNYRDSIRVTSLQMISDSERKEKFVKAIMTNLGEDFYIWGVGGDFITYLSPYLQEIKFTGLVDTKQNENFETLHPDNCNFKNKKILISSLRFKEEITKTLLERGADLRLIFGLDDLFTWFEA